MTTSEQISLWGAVFTGLSTLVAAGSVIFAIHSYRRQRDKEAFSSFRLSLVELRDIIATTDANLSMQHFSEIGHKVARRISSLLPESLTKELLVAYLTDSSKHDLIAQAVYLGRHDSEVIAKLDDYARQIERLPFRYREAFPLTFELTRKISFYITAISRKVASPKFIDMVIGNPDYVKNAISEMGLFQHESANDCLVDLENYLSCMPSQIMSKSQSLFDDAENLISILIERLSNLSDEALRKQSKAEKTMASSISKINENSDIEEAFELFKLQRAVFNDSEWDSIVEAKTRIFEKAHQSDMNKDT